MKETMIFVFWIIGAVGVLGLGGHLLFASPAWMAWFPHPALALLAVLVLPTGILTLFSSRWFFGKNHV